LHDYDSPEVHDYLTFIVSGVRQMNTLLDRMLQFSRINNTREKAKELIDLTETLTTIKQFFLPEINRNEVVIDIHSLPTILGNKARVQILFQNLIENGLRYNTSKTPTVSISSYSDNQWYIISIKDNGIGIEDQYQEKIFTIFSRLHSREKYSGTGIGLSITKKIIDRHGGSIWLDSQPGKGTIFYFRLPAAK